MAHDHGHGGEEYYKDQLSTIALCGLLGGVCVMLWQQGKLTFLAPNFQLPVLLGGLTLLGLVGVRAVLVWMSAGKPAAAACADGCGHDHDHDHHHSHNHDDGHDHAHPHEHGHDHAHDHVHEHSHSHDHGHGHHHHHHDDHGHDHGWSPWRYAVLLLPIVLFFLNLPPAPILTVRAIAAGQPTAAKEEKENPIPPVQGTVQRLDTQNYSITLATRNGDETFTLDSGVKVSVDGKVQPLAAITPGTAVTLTLGRKYSNLSAEYIIRQLQNRQLEDTGLDSSVALRGDGTEALSFPVIERAALYPDLRQALEGKMGKLRGQFMPGPSDRVASLVRIKMTCCLADVRPLEVVIIAPESLARFKPYEWVEVTGQIQFRKRKNRDAYLPVLQLQSPEQIQPTDAEPDFLY